MPLSEHVLADYQTTRLSLKGYPPNSCARILRRKALSTCAALKDVLNDGAPVRCAGVVLVRQCPGEGNTVFITLSDETGVCNVVIWETHVPAVSARKQWDRACCWRKGVSRKVRKA